MIKLNVKISKATFLNLIKSLVVAASFIFLTILLFVNIVASQTISPLYFQLVGGDKQAVVNYLKKIKDLPQFQKEMANYKSIYGKYIEDEVLKDERSRQQVISQLESLLEKNPASRDVLYNLYLLYADERNYQKASEYLGRVKEVDPDINIKN